MRKSIAFFGCVALTATLASGEALAQTRGSSLGVSGLNGTSSPSTNGAFNNNGSNNGATGVATDSEGAAATPPANADVNADTTVNHSNAGTGYSTSTGANVNGAGATMNSQGTTTGGSTTH